MVRGGLSVKVVGQLLPRWAQQQRRQKRLPKRTTEIFSLREKGYKIKQLTHYQFRINDKVDIYPTHNRYHILKSKERGGYKKLDEVLIKCL